MNSLLVDDLRRLEDLLATARTDYDTLAYIILEGATQVTFHSLRRSVAVPIGGDDVGHFNGLLAEAALTRIAVLEQEVAQAHGRLAQAAAEQQREAAELASYRQQARSAGAGAQPGRRRRNATEPAAGQQ